ncbi:MAG: hypothetical protein ACJAUE_001709 [Alcanivorax sp.]|jgi:hypothetical protein
MRRVMPLKKSRSFADAPAKSLSRAKPVDISQPVRRLASGVRRLTVAEQPE